MAGLQYAGFSKKDRRVIDETNGEETREEIVDIEEDTVPEVNEDAIRESIEQTIDFMKDFPIASESGTLNEDMTKPDLMIQTAEAEDISWEKEMSENETAGQFGEKAKYMNIFHVKPEFLEDIQSIKIPQFVRKTDMPMFPDLEYESLDCEALQSRFTLQKKDIEIDFHSVHAEMAKIDVGDNEDKPRAFHLREFEKEEYQKWFSALPSERKKTAVQGNYLQAIVKN